MSPNASPQSVLVAAVKLLISAMTRAERAALRPWLIARYGVDGSEAPALERRD